MGSKRERALVNYAYRVYARDPEIRDAYIGRELARRQRAQTHGANARERREREAKAVQDAFRQLRRNG